MDAISFSAVRDWKTCRQLYHYRRVQKLKKKITSMALKRGDLIHKLLEHHYNGGDWEDEWKRIDAQYKKLTEEEQEYYGELPSELHRIMRGYVKKYGTNRSDTTTVEVNFGQHGRPPLEIIPGLFVRGKIDRIFSDKRGMWVEEHKTSARSWPTETFRLHDLQTSLYVLAAEKLGYGKPVGVVFNYIKTKPPTIPRVLKNGTISRAKKINTDYDTYLQAVLDNDLDPRDYKEELERTKYNVFYEKKFLPKPDRIVNILLDELKIVALEIMKLKHHPYRNLTRDCENMCEFYPLCTAELMGLDTDFLLKAEYTKKDDYEWGGEDVEAEENEVDSDTE